MLSYTRLCAQHRLAILIVFIRLLLIWKNIQIIQHVDHHHSQQTRLNVQVRVAMAYQKTVTPTSRQILHAEGFSASYFICYNLSDTTPCSTTCHNSLLLLRLLCPRHSRIPSIRYNLLLSARDLRLLASVASVASIPSLLMLCIRPSNLE